MVGLRRLAAILACVLAFTVAPRPHAEIRPLTLYEKTGRAPLVVWGEVLEAEHRFAVIRNLDVIKAEIPDVPGETFRVAYKLDSFLRAPWQDKITFATGERLLLFLRKFTKQDGEKPDGDLFTLVWGADAKVPLPREGEEAWVDAARAFTVILEEEDPDVQTRMLKDALSEKNPYISDGAFEEMIKQGLGDMEMIQELTVFLAAPREPTRILAMRLLRQILSDARAAGRTLPGREVLADRLRGLAVNDPAPAFRVEAVRVLEALGGENVRSFLQRLAKEDPSQVVRYEAEKSLKGWVAQP